MSFLDRAREKALAAGEHLRSAADQLGGTADDSTTEPERSLLDAGTTSGEVENPSGVTRAAAGDVVQRGLDSARHGLASLVERLDPRLLADVVIKATSVQERTNAALRDKGSPYRIDGISITATIPPQVSFSINRSGEGGGDGAH
ncbi:MAG TPA: hypothetical protein VF013_01865 [Candidatus Limnocylindria bacterium]